jgi:hypothetical protein
MEIFRAFLFSLALFAGLAVISVLVAVIMKLIYFLVHRNENKKEIKIETETAETNTPGKTV